MSLEGSDIEIIRATWLCVRQDTVASGCLLFKELFTRYPQYLQLFPQFPDLDLEHMRDNKRLLKHAVKVIDTVTFVVDCLGDEKQSNSLHEALLELVKSHLRRQIGLEKFSNLGDVLIDFICDLNHSNGSKLDTKPNNDNDNNQQQQQQHLNQPNIDTKSLRLAWAKLYGIILSLVESEETTSKTA